MAALSLDVPSQKAITFPNDGLFTGHRSIAYGYNTPPAVYSTSLPLDSTRSLSVSFGRQYIWPDQFSLFSYIQSFVVLLVSQVFSFSICDRALHRIRQKRVSI